MISIVSAAASLLCMITGIPFSPASSRLTDKPLFLQVMSFLIPVIVQAYLSHRHNLFTVQQGRHLPERLLAECSHFVGMHPY